MEHSFRNNGSDYLSISLLNAIVKWALTVYKDISN